MLRRGIAMLNVPLRSQNGHRCAKSALLSTRGGGTGHAHQHLFNCVSTASLSPIRDR